MPSFLRAPSILRRAVVLVISLGFATVLPADAGSSDITRSDLLIWDYRDTAPAQVTLSAYHQWLLGYCQANPPKRLVLYVSDPLQSTSFCPFYDPTAVADTTIASMNFVGFLNTLAGNPATASVEVELLIDNAAFLTTNPAGSATACGSYSRIAGNATVNGIAPPTLAPEWQGLPYAMNWYATLMVNPALASAATNPIKGFTIDPEFPPPASGNTITGNHAYINNALWMDMFRTATPALAGQRIGITLGVDAHVVGKILTADLPLSSTAAAALAPCAQSCGTVNDDLCQYTCELLPRLSPTGSLTYRTTSGPIIDSVYLQVYSACGNATANTPEAVGFYRWITTGGCDTPNADPTIITPVAPWTTSAQTSAGILAATLVRQPAQPGIGTITAVGDATIPNPNGNPGGAHLTGIGTSFSLLPPDGRLQLMNGTTPIPPAQWKLFNPASSDTAIDVNGPVISQATPLPYIYTELVTFYPVPPATTAQADRFWFMFSAEKARDLPFFGWWQYPDFLSFVSEFNKLVAGPSASMPPFMDAAGNPISAAPNYGIYSLKQACANWGTTFYATAYPDGTTSAPCPADFNDNGAVEGADLSSLLNAWGTTDPSRDLNHDGTINGADLGELLNAWGTCSSSPL